MNNRFAQFETIEAYNAVNVAIIAYKDELTGGEYTRTNTLYAYNPEPESNWDGKYYMSAEPDLVEAGLFEGVMLLDAIPEQQPPNDTWLKADIQEWLTNNGITWTTSLTKAGLLALVP